MSRGRFGYDSVMRLLAAALLALTTVGVSAQAPMRQVPAPPDVARPPADAQKTASGLTYKVLQPGEGTATPAEDDYVTVQFTIWTTDGRTYDSSISRGMTGTYALPKTIKGWSEGVRMMKVGEKRRLWIPKNLAYEGMSGRPQGAVVSDVELIEIIRPPDKQAPADVAAPPSDAERTASGLAYKYIRRGDPNGPKPTRESRVTVHYTGWTTDGSVFDSSLPRGQRTTFGLGDVIEGWTEGMQLMVPGDKMRFWIPERLAYKGEGNGPRGMLLFEVELLAITP